MRAAPKALRLLPVCVIGLVTLLWPFSPATATTLEGKGAIQAKVKVPPQEGTKAKGKDKADAGTKGKDEAGVQTKGEDEANVQAKGKDKPKGKDKGDAKPKGKNRSPSSVTVVTPVGPPTVQLPATLSPAATTPDMTPGGTTGSGQSEPTNQAAAPPARRTKARSKRIQGRATASSTRPSLSSPLGAAA